MDSKDVHSLFEDWKSIHMSEEAKHAIRENLRELFDGVLPQRSKRPCSIAAIQFTLAALLFLGVLVFSGLLIKQPRLHQQMRAGTTGGALIPPSQFKPFVPPKGQDQAFMEHGVSGRLFIAGYGGEGTLAPMSPSPFMREASMAYVVAEGSNGKPVLVAKIATPKDNLGHRENVIHIPIWFSADNVWYGVIEDDYNHATTFVYQFTPSDTSNLGWTVRKFTPKSFNGQLLFKVENRLLVRSWAIGNAPIWYVAFTQTGLETRQITQQWPKQGSIRNSVTLTVHESVSHSGVVILKGSNTVHVRVGETLVMRIIGNHSVPITPLFYSDTSGDPGDGSLTTRLASPYKDAMIYRVVAPSRHGYAMMVPLEGNPSVHGLSKITIVSQ